MPLISAQNSNTDNDKINVEEILDEADEVKSEASKSDHQEGCQERTFLTFSDHDTYRSAFPMSKRRLTQQKTCPITRLPAKYYDPVTQHPYANLQAFRILRETYYNQLEQKGDKSDPEVRKTYLTYRVSHFEMALMNWLLTDKDMQVGFGSWNFEIGNFWLPQPFFKKITSDGLNSLR